MNDISTRILVVSLTKKIDNEIEALQEMFQKLLLIEKEYIEAKKETLELTRITVDLNKQLEELIELHSGKSKKQIIS